MKTLRSLLRSLDAVTDSESFTKVVEVVTLAGAVTGILSFFGIRVKLLPEDWVLVVKVAFAVSGILLLWLAVRWIRKKWRQFWHRRAMHLGLPSADTDHLHIMRATTRVRLGAPLGKAPFLLITGRRPEHYDEKGVYAYVDLFPRPRQIRQISLDLAIPEIDDRERQLWSTNVDAARRRLDEHYILRALRKVLWSKTNEWTRAELADELDMQGHELQQAAESLSDTEVLGVADELSLDEVAEQVNRRASLDIIAPGEEAEDEMLFQVVVRADGYVKVAEENADDGYDRSFIQDEPLFDTSEWLRINLSRRDDGHLLELRGTDPVSGTEKRHHWPDYGEQRTCKPWPQEVNIRLVAATNSATPIAWFTKPIIT